jgi:hypothetical protein
MPLLIMRTEDLNSNDKKGLKNETNDLRKNYQDRRK